MPTLNWIGKEKIIHHHLDIPYRVLNHGYGFTEQGNQQHETGSGNSIIHGDNLEALKSLLPHYEGKIKCIYIDPPYNTGNEGWVYNDNVSHPKLQKWLGETVGKESDDLTRHDKWLCMMYPRLQLLHRLLADDGAIFISIDDNEVAHLKLIMDEVFGANNFIEIFSWVKTETPANLSIKTKKAIEYIICYQKTKTNLKFKGLEKNSNSSNGLMNQTNNEKELVFPANLIDTALKDGTYKAGVYGTKSYKIELLEDTKVKDGYFITPTRLKGKFKWSQENLLHEIKRETKISIRTLAFSPSYEKKEYEPEVPWNMINKDFGVKTNESASTELNLIFKEKVFDFPKTPSLIEYILNFVCSKNSIILDSFAGSGTTAHAVLNLNKEDGGNRKFILIELENYAETITAERVKRVIQGYADVEGTGGSFDFYTVGEPLFDEQHNLNEAVPVEKIREYIWYSETRSHLPLANNAGPFLGTHNATDYYFIYDKNHLTTLDYDALAEYITRKSERYVIYADNCLLPESFMRSRNIVFKKIPRNITRF